MTYIDYDSLPPHPFLRPVHLSISPVEQASAAAKAAPATPSHRPVLPLAFFSPYAPLIAK